MGHEQSGRPGETSVEQRELGKRVRGLSEQLEAEALKKVGLAEFALSGKTDYTVILQSFQLPLIRVEIGGRQWEALYPDGELRQDRKVVRVKKTDEQGNTTLELARFIDPEGNMYQAADSSQGRPWYDANVPPYQLAEAVDCLETISGLNHNVAVNLSTTVWHRADAASSAA